MKTGWDYSGVRFRKPGLKGITLLISVTKMGGGPYHKNWASEGVDMKIPTRFEATVMKKVANQYGIETVAEFEKKVVLKKLDDYPVKVLHELFKKAESFCNKHGFVNVDPRWK